jgi:hypothetical protein
LDPAVEVLEEEQRKQEACPCPYWYVPAAQGVQDVPFVAALYGWYVPAGQKIGTVDPAAQNVPEGHLYPCCEVRFVGVEDVVPGPNAYPGVPGERDRVKGVGEG